MILDFSQKALIQRLIYKFYGNVECSTNDEEDDIKEDEMILTGDCTEQQL